MWWDDCGRDENSTVVGNQLGGMQNAHKRVAALVLLGAIQASDELPGVVEAEGRRST